MRRDKRQMRRTGAVLPACRSIILCDNAVRGPGGKWSLLGIFSTFNLAQFPGPMSPCHLYAALSGGVGAYDLDLEIRSLRDPSDVAKTEVRRIEFRDRINSHEICVPLPPLGFRLPGEYELVLLTDGHEVGQMRFTAKLAR